jgi:arylsulfatase A-like enzyme
MKTNSAGRPNILVVMTDQQRRETVGALPGAWFATTGIDRIAAEGVAFTRAYAECPICVPTRATFLSGLHAHQLDVPGFGAALDNGGTVTPEHPNLARSLARAGYDTAIIGKTHLQPYGCDLGFAESHLLENSCSDAVEYNRYLHGHGFQKDDYWHNSAYDGVWAYRSRVPLEHYGDAWVGRLSADYVRRQADGDHPFFLWASFYKPHNPYNPPAPYHGRIDPRSLPAPIRDDPDAASRGRVYREREAFYRARRAGREPTASDIQEARARYGECVQLVDDQVAALCEALRETGQWDNTAILFASDHGDMLGDHGHWHKTLAFESSAGVPLVLRVPGGARGARSDALVSTIDLMPTCLDLAGLPVPAALSGRSLLPLSLDPGTAGRDTLYLECSNFPGAWHAAVTRRWKYVHFVNGGEEELYDLHEDPEERRNLAGLPAFEDRRLRERERLVALLRTQGPAWALRSNRLAEIPFAASACRYTLEKSAT